VVTRGQRNAIIAASIAFTLVVVAAVGTTAFFLIRKQHRQDDVAEAARVATVYNKKVSAYRSAVHTALTSADADEARKVRAAFKAAVVKTPKLGDAPEWGKTHSRTYIKAEESVKTLTKPYDDVSAVLDEAVVGQPFIKAALKALKTDIDDYVGKGKYFYNGSAFRDKLVPGYTKIMKKFDKVPVPKGRESVARKVHAALADVIKDGKHAAAELDAGRNTSINARAKYVEAATAVYAYQRSLKSRLASAIEDADGGVTGSTGSAT